MSRTSYIYLYICIAAPNAVRPKKRIQRERKSSASQCLKGAPLKLVILKPPPLLHSNCLSFLMFKKRGGSGMEEGGLPLYSEPSRIGGW